MTGGELDLEKFVPYRLSVASNAVSRLIARAYQDAFGLSVPEWRLIAVLKEREGSTQKDLVQITQMDKVAVSRAAAALESRALIRRTPSQLDGRAWLLSLTLDGLDLHARIAPMALQYERRLLASFSPDEIDRLRTTLLRLQETAAELEQPVSA